MASPGVNVLRHKLHSFTVSVVMPSIILGCLTKTGGLVGGRLICRPIPGKLNFHVLCRNRRKIGKSVFVEWNASDRMVLSGQMFVSDFRRFLGIPSDLLLRCCFGRLRFPFSTTSGNLASLGKLFCEL